MQKSNFQRYFWTATYVFTGIIIGLLVVWLYADYQCYNAYTLLLWSLAYMMVGSLIGFIFSVPKIISENANALAIDKTGLNAAQKNRVEENTNLTQISDWLTKILIGAGLVQINEAPKFVLHVSKVMAQGIRKVSETPKILVELNIIDSATIMCAAIILYFITWGFISGYLVMKLVLTEQFADTSNDQNSFVVT